MIDILFYIKIFVQYLLKRRVYERRIILYAEHKISVSGIVQEKEVFILSLYFAAAKWFFWQPSGQRYVCNRLDQRRGLPVHMAQVLCKKFFREKFFGNFGSVRRGRYGFFRGITAGAGK